LGRTFLGSGISPVDSIDSDIVELQHEDVLTMGERDNTDILRAVFDALPSLVFVVDQDVRIQECNAAAAELLMADKGTVIKQRAGDIMHCVHSHEGIEGCGTTPSCRKCIIRASVTEAFNGGRVVRRRTRIDLVKGGEKVEIYALITTSPFFFEMRTLVLLVIEDISEIAELYRMIPICSVCRKVRDDQKSWMVVEAYFKNNWGVDFSHGLCPDCYRIERDKLEACFKTG
jgi:PAS domain-containing protein